MNNQQAEQLIRKFLKGECTEEERNLIIDWYAETEKNQVDLSDRDYSEMKEELLKVILSYRGPKLMKIKRNWYAAAAAAVVLCVLSVSFIFYLHSKRNSVPPVEFTTDILPGKNRATLTLSNGNPVDLSNTQTGHLINDAAVEFYKDKDGSLVYGFSKNKHGKSVGEPNFNILTTPAGGQFNLILPDGSKVWLNASSSIKFPVDFSKAERKVYLTGEGYFEISKNKLKPFHVHFGGQTIKVLGTHFNVNTYTDEPVSTTTLLEGKIQIFNQVSTSVLVPGQQASLKDNEKILIKNVDAEREIAWKNGVFEFKANDIKFIMRQLSRWYDVQVIYQGELPKDLFTGKIRRNMRLSDALKILSNQNIHFKIQKNTIIVLP